MNDNEIIQVFLPLYSDLRPEDAFNIKKPLLAHYTSINVLEKILADDQVWFSNPLFMNDLEEVRFGILQSAPLVLSHEGITAACKTKARADIFKQAFNRYYNIFDTDHAIDTYVFCLSEHSPDDKDGMLSMWRGYGGNGNGAAIVFDASKVEARPESPLIIAKVTYASRDKRLDWIRGTIQKFSELLNDADIPDDKLYLPAHILFERIKLFSLFTKHHGFEEENEWRIVYMRDRDVNKKMDSMFHYWVGPRGVEPKLRFKIKPIEGLTADDLSLEKIVDKIILGPSFSSYLAKATILRMLDRLQKSAFKDRIYASTIPFRST